MNMLHYLITCALLFAFGLTEGQIKVCPTCELRSIKEAISMANSGDLLVIGPGVYPESEIVIDKALELRGEGKVVIDGSAGGHVIRILADSVILSGLVIRHVEKSYTKDYAAVYLSRVSHFELYDLELQDVFFGILVEKSHEGLIRNNLVSSAAKDEAGAGNGIHLWHCSGITIRDNEIHHMRDGIYFEFVSNSMITGNVSHDNIRYGLHFMFSNHDEYHDNVFTRNGAGVAVMFSKFINMSRNSFKNNWGTASYGLLLKEIYDADIRENLFEENTVGINLEGSTRIQYENNRFVGNGWAVRIAGACYTNHFTHNNFLHNAFDISYNSKLNDNSFERNYWSSYTGYDLDRDGIGDVPFRPVKLFSYIVNQTPETIVLLRSLFVDLINFSEKVSPVFTPDNLMDHHPLMQMIP